MPTRTPERLGSILARVLDRLFERIDRNAPPPERPAA